MENYSYSELEKLATSLKKSLGIIQKKDIQTVSKILDLPANNKIPIGDDCAAIKDGDGYLLFAAEGMWHVLVERDPWFSGWCSVMVNISDITAMGGKATAIVDTIWTENSDKAIEILEGIKAASIAYNVPIVGGHSNFQSAYNALSVAIIGKAKKLITSNNARPGDLLVIAINKKGKMHPQFSFWNAATEANPISLREGLNVLPLLAQQDLCCGGKDISMGGIIGTCLMLIESSRCGAILNLDSIIPPANISLETWLKCFPSYGFLLSIAPSNLELVKKQFERQNIYCAAIGEINFGSELLLRSAENSCLFWDWQKNKLMGLSSLSV